MLLLHAITNSTTNPFVSLDNNYLPRDLFCYTRLNKTRKKKHSFISDGHRMQYTSKQVMDTFSNTETYAYRPYFHQTTPSRSQTQNGTTNYNAHSNTFGVLETFASPAQFSAPSQQNNVEWSLPYTTDCPPDGSRWDSSLYSLSPRDTLSHYPSVRSDVVAEASYYGMGTGGCL